jgi:hypothetical protein
MTHCFKYELNIEFHHIHCFLKHFDSKLFKISLKNKHKWSKTPQKGHIKKSGYKITVNRLSGAIVVIKIQ